MTFQTIAYLPRNQQNKKQMKQCIKITSFIIAISALVVFSKQIQDEIVDSYNHCVNQLASRTMTSSNPIGF
ncbi:MAG: hypothetical protein ACI8QQ_002639 [Psychroserpens sp.]